MVIEFFWTPHKITLAYSRMALNPPPNNQPIMWQTNKRINKEFPDLCVRYIFRCVQDYPACSELPHLTELIKITYTTLPSSVTLSQRINKEFRKSPQEMPSLECTRMPFLQLCWGDDKALATCSSSGLRYNHHSCCPNCGLFHRKLCLPIYFTTLWMLYQSNLLVNWI